MTDPVLIIGMAPSRTSDPSEPLSGNSGRRLADLCGLDMPTFIDRFQRLNLVDEYLGPGGRKGDRWLSIAEARGVARKFEPVVAGRKVVLIGFAVAAAFRLTQPAMVFVPHWGGSFAFCPHPSGVNLWWNHPRNVEQARAFWRALAQEP